MRLESHDTGVRAATADPGTIERETTAAERLAMREAVLLARKGVGGTHPNPRVGAVVLRDGLVVARGWHERAGGAHAETRALEAAGAAARGATLVVTLEPCAHHGRTPPCVDAILASGVRRVVVGMIDPNPIVNGRGVEALRRAGVDVLVGLQEAACLALNEPYVQVLATGRPRVTLKAMVSLDGRLAADAGDSRGLGGEEEQRLCHRLRAQHDAVLVGIGTALADDPLLTVRRVRGRSPWRLVLDSSLRLPTASSLAASAASAPVVVATVVPDDGEAGGRARALEARGVRIWRFAAGPDGRVPLRPLLDRLAAEGRYALLVEGGAGVHTSFLREGLADRVAVGIAPLLLGGSGARGWTGDLGRARVADAIELEGMTVRRLGRDVWLEGAVRRAAPPGDSPGAAGDARV